MYKYRLLLVCLTLLSGCASGVLAKECELSNAALRAMERARIVFSFETGETREFIVKLANNATTRAAGFQRVCASTINEQPILFVFDYELTPRFHMHNVVAAIDIAFFDQQGNIDSIQSMQPYVLGSNRRPLYSPKGNIIGALEAYPGFFTKHGISTKAKISWQGVEG